MKKKWTKVIIAALAVMMVFAMAGCGKSKSSAVIDKNTIYKEEILDIKFPEGSYINTVSVGKSKIFFSGYSYDQKTYNSQYFIGSCNTDGTEFITNNIGGNDDGHSVYVESLYASPDDTAFAIMNEYFEDYSDPENYIWESHYYLAKADANGNIVSKNEISEDSGISYIEQIAVIDENTLVLYSNNTFYKLDGEANIIAKKEISDGTYINNVFQFKDKSLGFSYWNDDGEVLKKFDVNTMEIGEDVTFPVAVGNYTISSGNEDYDVLFRSSGSIYGYNKGDSGLTEVINLVNSDINTSYFNTFSRIDAGTYIGYYTEYLNDSNNTVIAKYTKIDPKDYVEKEILTLGCVYIDSDIRTEVIKFNKSSDKYRVVIKDYSSYNTNDDYSAGESKLNNDIASGQAPDIIISSSNSEVGSYISKGLFVDLHKFLDSDTVVNKSDIWPNLIASCETDGKLYALVPSFYVQTLAGKKSVLGDRTGWTIDEMQAYEQSLPQGTSLFESTLSRESFISMMLYAQANDYINLSNATCDFDSPEFKSILTYAAKLPKSDDINYDDDYYTDYSSTWRENKAVLYTLYLSDVSSYQEVLKGYIGEDINFIGYPTKDGSNGSLISFSSALYISSKSKNQEGAWEFIRTFWGEDYQKSLSWGVPALKSQFDEKCKTLMERPSYQDYETGETVYYDNTWWVGETQFIMEPLTQEEVDTLTAFVGSVTKSTSAIDTDVLTIINDEAESFFNGQKSVDDVTTIIQNRVSTYLKEKQ